MTNFFSWKYFSLILQLVFFGLCAGLFYKKRPVDDEPVFVDEHPPNIYFDPNDPAIGSLIFGRIQEFI